MMKRIRVIAAGLVIAALWTFPVNGEPERASSDESCMKLIGSWQVTSAQTSLILSIEPGHKALVLWIRKGSHSTLRTSWKPLPGGILVQGIPRIRLWAGRKNRDNELRAEVEAIPELGYDPNKEFHDHFFMRRIKFEETPRHLLDRPLPERWKKETLGQEWNASAGRTPLPQNRKEKAEQQNSPDKE